MSVHSIYFERQEENHCCLHALNNTVTRDPDAPPTFHAHDMQTVRGKTGDWGDLEIETVLTHHPLFEHVNFFGSAIKTKHIFDFFTTYPTFLGFVVKTNWDHWVSLRKVDAPKPYQMVDSMADAPGNCSSEEAWNYLAEQTGAHHAIFRIEEGVQSMKELMFPKRRKRDRV